MKKLLIFMFVFGMMTSYGQTRTRKTRSDKGGHHTHTTKYYVKQAVNPKKTKISKKK